MIYMGICDDSSIIPELAASDGLAAYALRDGEVLRGYSVICAESGTVLKIVCDDADNYDGLLRASAAYLFNSGRQRVLFRLLRTLRHGLRR